MVGLRRRLPANSVRDDLAQGERTLMRHPNKHTMHYLARLETKMGVVGPTVQPAYRTGVLHVGTKISYFIVLW